jgi:hypothetical protein
LPERISQLTAFVERFTAENSELLILYLSHDFDTDHGYTPLNETQWNTVLDLLEQLNNRCGGLAGDITEYKISELIGNGKACVIVITEGPISRPDKGIYPSSQFPHYDQYTDTDDGNQMASDQIAKLHQNRNLVQDGSDQFHLLSWTLTLEGAQNTPVIGNSISELSLVCDVSLSSAAYQAFTPFSYPSVLYMNFVGSAKSEPNSEALAIAMAVNLYMASQNCYVGGGRI